MGYSISQEQHEKLERNRRNGRLCGFSTGRGGCFHVARVKTTQETWSYAEDKLAGAQPRIDDMVFCKNHAEAPGYEGTNFRVIAIAPIDETDVRDVRAALEIDGRSRVTPLGDVEDVARRFVSQIRLA